MTKTITWSDPIPHDGSSDCPVDARDVQCLLLKEDNTWTKQGVWGQHLWWQGIKAYRLPITQPDTVTADLVAALEAMLQSVCGPTGFATAVRNNTDLAFPWPSLDIAEQKARAALAAYKEQQK